LISIPSNISACLSVLLPPVFEPDHWSIVVDFPILPAFFLLYYFDTSSLSFSFLFFSVLLLKMFFYSTLIIFYKMSGPDGAPDGEHPPSPSFFSQGFNPLNLPPGPSVSPSLSLERVGVSCRIDPPSPTARFFFLFAPPLPPPFRSGLSVFSYLLLFSLAPKEDSPPFPFAFSPPGPPLLNRFFTFAPSSPFSLVASIDLPPVVCLCPLDHHFILLVPSPQPYALYFCRLIFRCPFPSTQIDKRSPKNLSLFPPISPMTPASWSFPFFFRFPPKI